MLLMLGFLEVQVIWVVVLVGLNTAKGQQFKVCSDIAGGQCLDSNVATCNGGQWDHWAHCDGYWGIRCCVTGTTSQTTPPVTTPRTTSTPVGSTPVHGTSGTTTTAPDGNAECAALPGLRRNRVVGGKEAPPNRWPSVGSLHTIKYGQPMSSTHDCGATIIAPQWVVTAAHCVDSIYDDADDYQLVFGDHNQDQSSGREVIARVSRIIKHEQYQSDGPGFPNDIALLKLSQPVQFTRYIQPACLPTVNTVFTPSDECWILGWGETKGTGESNVLRELRLDITPNTNCSAMWSKYPHSGPRVWPFHICVGVGGNGTCNGDSGGPLMCKKGNQWMTVGVSSWAMRDCVTPGFPAVYSRITSYLPWIRHIIQQDTTTTPGAIFG
ncbi:tryptase-2 [Lingula anatina]|uniref:Tryptase-2 n=1 Tax=Lingula anatina TaxID=7574 RepID=A0A1S3KH24_LINAN|nr:tryptase-2 [Lingula anatina]|eukprot:XP_013421764.1 tryptase-2 [Lingula anatina]